MTLRWPTLLGFLLALGAMATGLSVGADPVEGWRLAARWTARVGFPLFLLTYLAAPLVRVAPAPWTRALAHDRRWWGLGFAASHTVHLAALITFYQVGTETRTFASLIPGLIGYTMLYAMALTSSDAAMRALGRNWKRLHTVGIHTLWLIYTLAYLSRTMKPETMREGAIGTALGLGALGLRLLARRRRSVQPVAA